MDSRAFRSVQPQNKLTESEGMLLAASDPEGEAPGVFRLSPDSGAQSVMHTTIAIQ